MKSVEVLVNGKPIKQNYHLGQWWIEARKGLNYEVKIKNNNGFRVMAVVSIDGLDVITGEPATSDSSGYILAPYSAYSIKGFRTSNEEVNLFEFSDKGESYAVESPSGEASSKNCGVIGVRIFREKYKMPLIRSRIEPVRRYDFAPPLRDNWMLGDMLGDTVRGSSGTTTTDWMEQERERGVKGVETLNFCASAAPAPDFDIGTKFSDISVTDKVTYTEFENGGLIEEQTIYYASLQSLKKAGIIVEEKPAPALPQPFKDGPFCKKPRR